MAQVFTAYASQKADGEVRFIQAATFAGPSAPSQVRVVTIPRITTARDSALASHVPPKQDAFKAHCNSGAVA